MNIELRPFKKEMVCDIVNLWNKNVVGKEIYAEFTEEGFVKQFLENENYDNDGSVVCVNNDKIIGFGNAIFHKSADPSTNPGYISCIVVDEEYQRKGIGTKILLHLENYLKQTGHHFVRNYFGCPINLKWYVPGYNKHEHAGSPAVPFNTPYYFLLLANGYIVNGHQDAFHVDLTKFKMPQLVIDKIKENEKDGYTLTIYDAKIHHGFEEMFDALENEGFRMAVRRVLAKPNPDPLLIAQKDGEILGFTGPIRTEPSGRAFLAGVAIHPKAQKRGLGKTMFCTLCQKSKENGATFMTLFTGSDNRARNIYLYAGLKIVQSFCIMRKELI